MTGQTFHAMRTSAGVVFVFEERSVEAYCPGPAPNTVTVALTSGAVITVPATLESFHNAFIKSGNGVVLKKEAEHG